MYCNQESLTCEQRVPTIRTTVALTYFLQEPISAKACAFYYIFFIFVVAFFTQNYVLCSEFA